MRWLGIDFSGNHLMWRPGCRRSNVWIAEVTSTRSTYRLSTLRRVQELPSKEHPFQRLVRFLRTGDYAAAAVDAPFSVPSKYLPSGGYRALLKLAATLPRDPTRPFPKGEDLVHALCPSAPIHGFKAYRETDYEWINSGVNTRSTMWAGRRGGAPMTAACLVLLAAAARPLWPWSSTRFGVVLEAFPSAQLLGWDLTRVGYNGETLKATAIRMDIIADLRLRILLPPKLEEKMRLSADALDAVLCAFAAIAVTQGRLVSHPGISAKAEGWIAVHSK